MTYMIPLDPLESSLSRPSSSLAPLSLTPLTSRFTRSDRTTMATGSRGSSDPLMIAYSDLLLRYNSLPPAATSSSFLGSLDAFAEQLRLPVASVSSFDAPVAPYRKADAFRDQTEERSRTSLPDWPPARVRPLALIRSTPA